jgi:ATP-dependent DNA helicase RecQ
MPLEDIAATLKIKMENLLEELNMIVDSGTKLNIDYYLEENLDEDIIEEIFDYFHEAESDSVDEAFRELEEEDITLEEIFMVRIKFMSEVVN